MNSINKLLATTFAAMTLMVAGCATGPEAVENDFGNSVRHMTEAQTVNPSAPADALPIDGSDGERTINAIQSYRKDVGKREEVKQDVIISVDK